MSISPFFFAGVFWYFPELELADRVDRVFYEYEVRCLHVVVF